MACGARLGRRRHRGRGRHARPADLHGDPEVVGFRLTGKTERGRDRDRPRAHRHRAARRAGVVGKFVEFFGEGLGNLPVEDRATIANMAPEYGATCGFFPVDEETLAYLDATDQAIRALPGRGLRADARRVSRRRHGRPGVHRLDRARSWRRRAVDRRTEAAAGSCRPPVPQRLRRSARQGIRQDEKEKRCPCRAPISISAMAMWRLPPSPPAPTRRTPCDGGCRHARP